MRWPRDHSRLHAVHRLPAIVGLSLLPLGVLYYVLGTDFYNNLLLARQCASSAGECRIALSVGGTLVSVGTVKIIMFIEVLVMASVIPSWAALLGTQLYWRGRAGMGPFATAGQGRIKRASEDLAAFQRDYPARPHLRLVKKERATNTGGDFQ